MRRFALLLTLTFCGVLAEATGGAAAPPAKGPCVGATAGCYATLQAAVDAAHPGDSIVIRAGVFAGGVTIDKSINIVGAGARLTIIRGGGPVLTIGRFDASREPVVSIRGITITGGVTHSSGQSLAVTGQPGVIALGGGLEIPPAADFGTGATVRISDSVITNNRVAPVSTVPSGLPCGTTCPFALAGGGGVDNWGLLTVVNTTVSDNASGGPIASDANAAGIYSPQGNLTLQNSVVTGNRTAASRPNGRFSEAGGVFISSTAFYTDAHRPAAKFTMTGSRVTANSADLSSGFSSEVEAHAQSGGVFIGGNDDCSQPDSGCVDANITDSAIIDNRVTSHNAEGDAVAFSGGVNNDGALILRHTSISANRVSAVAGPGSGAGAFADSGGLGMGGYATIDRSLFAANTVTATASDGDAGAAFGGISTGNPSLATTVRDSVITGNRLMASTNAGFAGVQGAGVGHLDGPMLFSRAVITRNVGRESGPSGSAQGGGIANFAGASAPLTIRSSVITANQLTAPATTTPQGGGIYTEVPVAVSNSVIHGNKPDQCFGPCT
jgi:hypothetical protein